MNRNQAQRVAYEIGRLIGVSVVQGPLIEALVGEEPSIDEPKFKVGDRVKTSDGRLGTVIEALPHVEKDPKRPLVKYDDGYQGWHWQGSLERVTVEVTLTEGQQTTLTALAKFRETNPWSSHVEEIAKNIDPSGVFFERAREQIRKEPAPAWTLPWYMTLNPGDVFHNNFGDEYQVLRVERTGYYCRVLQSHSAITRVAEISHDHMEGYCESGPLSKG